MHKHLMAISVLAASMLAVGTASAQDKPGYMYDTFGKPAKDTYGECVKSIYRQRDAYPECEKVAEKKTEKYKDKAVLEGATHFDFDKYQLKPAGKQVLDDLVGRMKAKNADLTGITVSGHTDSIGSEAYNMKLGQRRADTVKDYLVSRGIPASKITTKSFGESQPVASNKTAEGRAKNRRAEVEVDAVITK
jgi:OOP family OmpA-OmpF porin